MSQKESTGVHVTPMEEFFAWGVEPEEVCGEVTADCPAGLTFRGYKPRGGRVRESAIHVTPQEQFFTEHESLWFGEPGAECSRGMLN